MSSREEFEVWAEPHGILLGRLVSDERYESMTTEWAYRAWQESRVAALEEAAKECDKAYSYDPDADDIAASIRALKGK